MSAETCPACRSRHSRVFHEVTGIPVNSCLLLGDRDEALSFPRGDLVLAFCEVCGFIWNCAFDRGMAEYSGRYEETQGFSPRFVAFARDLASRWIERYGLRDRSILEIGCGKGEFLQYMCELGPNRGIGIDPSFDPARIEEESSNGMRFIRDFYGRAYSELVGDAIVCRHTLEHIPDVLDFMQLVRRSIGDRPGVVALFELPDVRRVLDEVAFWDLYYEHCSYFSMESLTRLFGAAEFDVVGRSMEFDDQYLVIEALPGPTATTAGPGEDLADLDRAVARFAARYPVELGRWRSSVADIRTQGRRAVIWGAGSKGVSYLTTLDITDEIRYAVDINPHKAGKYMAGTGHEIVPPDFLREYQPDDVIVMNPIYTDEIKLALDCMDLTPNVWAV